jgi:hypothetical protein
MTKDTDAPQRPKCFVIMPISDVPNYESGHFGGVYEHLLKPAINNAGYTAVRSDDANKTDYIVVAIIQKILESEMILCDLSARNPNVMYELGIRHAFNKPVTLVRDKITDKVFDIQGLRYQEYDHSLRVDSVEKDIEKISKAIKETAAATADDINSVIQLAGLKPAETPVNHTVSGDTQILLSAIASLERRLEPTDNRSKSQRFFRIEGDKVFFEDETDASLGDQVYDSKGTIIGEVVDIHPAEEKIFIRNSVGKVIPFAAYSIKSRGLSMIPF